MFGSIAVVLTAIVGFLFKSHKSWLMTFLQNFCGVWFIFSGWVKAIDPLGTVYKLEDYFAEFHSTFEPTWFGFLAPMFPWLAEHAIWITVPMIIFEIILGAMLVLGHSSKVASWAFWILLAFFTLLTGFTYLTGYVPNGANFFEFGSWAEYDKNNMKVTDCGCFGDFLKLEPKTSFFKDLFLMIPAFYFLFKHKTMHQLFTPKIRNIGLGLATVGLLFYCFKNYVWDLPHTDFRPFKNGVNVKAQRIAEEDAMANVKILKWVLKNKASGEMIELADAEYMKNYKNYPKAEWEYLDQIKTEPTLETTKISEMEFTDINDGYDIALDLLEEENYSFTFISSALEAEVIPEKLTVSDSIYLIDTVTVFDPASKKESIEIVRALDRVEEKIKTKYTYKWDKDFIDNYSGKVATLAKMAGAEGVKSRMIVGAADPAAIKTLADEAKLEGVQLCSADDLLLKTIIRSNPGVVLWKNGQIIQKWHINKLPDYQEIKSQYMQ